EISLAENTVRETMHAADQIEAFRKLIEDQGMTPEHVGELALSGGTALALSQLMVRELELRVVQPTGSGSGGQLPRIQLESLTVSVELDTQQLGLFTTITRGQNWTTGTLTFEPGSGLASIGLGRTLLSEVSWDHARNAEQLHVVRLVLSPAALTLTPESGGAVTWSFETATGTGTIETARMRFVLGGALAQHEPVLDLTTTVVAPVPQVGGGASPGLARLGELTVQGAPVGNWTAQWLLRMGRATPWTHDAANMPLDIRTVEGGGPIARLEASCLVSPTRLVLRSEGGRLFQEVSFGAGLLRMTSFDGLGTATSQVWNFVTNSASTECP
ncbi:MAG TPA: hypothetical protein PK095_13620, partial [Myxococcota bacterium]|nr:hypothetical protein [Myxococcota bacterium]